jgi:hypothetical protein
MLPKPNDENGPDVVLGSFGPRLLFAPILEASNALDQIVRRRRLLCAPKPFYDAMHKSVNSILLVEHVPNFWEASCNFTA